MVLHGVIVNTYKFLVSNLNVIIW